MHKYLLLIAVFVPLAVFADIAGEVLTKDQACETQDGESNNRLQIFLNWKKSDILYFYKKETTLYYVVPMFPYLFQSSPWVIEDTYHAGIFLYKYNCKTKKSTRISWNLKNLATEIWWPINWTEKIDPKTRRALSYGKVYEVSDKNIILSLGIPQTWVSATIYIPYQ